MTALRDAIGILHETKNRFERRVPLVPEQIADLVRDGIEVRVQRSPTRAFRDEEFSAVGATLVDDPTDCRVLVGVKEVKTTQVRPNQTVLCFSHTIKGQSHNMPLLEHFLREHATLIDYECIVDDAGVRQVAFGRYAGLAGAHETLWTLAHRLHALGRKTALVGLRHAVDYRDLADMTSSTARLLDQVRVEQRAAGLGPLVVAVTGEGRVSKGALEYFDLVGARRATVAECRSIALGEGPQDVPLVVLPIADSAIYERAGGSIFEFSDYVAHPEQYVCKGSMYLPLAHALVNGLYWDQRFPRLLDDSTLWRMYRNKTLPTVLGDVACDIRGGIEWTGLATQNDDPAFVYDPTEERASVGVGGDGVAIMSVDNLPTALPRDASVDFSRALAPFMRAFFGASFANGSVADLPLALRTAVVVACGHLTPRHADLARFIGSAAS